MSASQPSAGEPTRAQVIARRLLSLGMITIGITHFTHEPLFTAIVPDALPSPRTLVWISGVFEILGGLGLEVQRTRRLAAWGLIALFVAVFPANIYMAVMDIPYEGESLGIARWIRLPFQALFMYWAWWCTRVRPKA